MRIITLGQPSFPAPWWAGLSTTCKKCLTVVELDLTDIPSATWGSRNPGERRLTVSQFKCPVCTGFFEVRRPLCIPSTGL